MKYVVKFAVTVVAVVAGEWIWWEIVTELRASGWIPTLGFWLQ